MGEVATRLVEIPATLTERQQEVLRLVQSGATNKEIAYKLGISQQTVKNHVRDVLRRSGVNNRTELTANTLQSNYEEMHRILTLITNYVRHKVECLAYGGAPCTCGLEFARAKALEVLKVQK